MATGSAPLTRIAIAIPVRDEAARLGRLLHALAEAARRSPLPVTALVLANNCTDHSASIAGRFSDPFLTVEVTEATLPNASAGLARRVAMDLAAVQGALVMTTDGDAVPDADWIAAALRAVNAGADLVCGMIDTDCRHVLGTPSGRRITEVESAYATLQHELRHRIDRMTGRQGADRPHYIESAASMAIRADRYLMIGGLPDVRSSEDRALVHRAESFGLTVRYADDMMAYVSGRLHGRAEGGMAEALRDRMRDPDPFGDQAMLAPALLQSLWMQAVTGLAPDWPSRAVAQGGRMRASDLEAALPVLESFICDEVRPNAAMPWAA